MLYLNDEKDEVILQVVRQGLKEKFAWENILSYIVLITEEEDAKQNWEELYGQKYPEKEQIAPVQPKKEKRKESKVVKAKLPKPKKPQKQETEKPVELPNDIPGQTEIEKDFPEMLPEAGETTEIQSDFIRAGQHKEENCHQCNAGTLWRLWKNLWIIQSRWKKMRETQKREPIQNRWISPKKNRIRLAADGNT